MGLRVAPALIDATGDDHPEVRRGASQALSKIGPAIIPSGSRRSDIRTQASVSCRQGLVWLWHRKPKDDPGVEGGLGDSESGYKTIKKWLLADYT